MAGTALKTDIRSHGLAKTKGLKHSLAEALKGYRSFALGLGRQTILVQLGSEELALESVLPSMAPGPDQEDINLEKPSVLVKGWKTMAHPILVLSH